MLHMQNQKTAAQKENKAAKNSQETIIHFFIF